MNEFFTFMVDWSLKSAATVALGLAAASLLSRRSAATRHLVWRMTLVAVALLPIAMAFTVRAGTPAVMEPVQAPVRAMILPLKDATIMHMRTTTSAPVAGARSWDAVQGACAVYAAGLAVLLLAWLAGYFKIRRIASTANRDGGPFGLHPVLTAIEPELRVPVTFGLLKPVIVFPRDAANWPAERVRAATLHETAHIARRDWAWQTACAWLRAVQWFNPAVWLLSASLNSTSEAAADDEVLTGFGMGQSVYAGELLKVAEAARGNMRAATAMARRGGVALRLKRIVSQGIERGRPRRRFILGLAIAFTVGGVLLAAGTVAGTETLGGGKTYEARLSHGGIVRMVAMADAVRKGPLWGPDGRPASISERELLKPILNSDAGKGGTGRIVDFYLQVSKLPMKRDESENGIFRIVHPENGWQYNGGGNTSSSDGRLQWDQWLVPVDARTFDMDCAITYGPFKEVAHGTFGDHQFHQRFESQGDNKRVSFTIPASYGQTQTELYLFDKDGNGLGSPLGPLEGHRDGSSGGFTWDFPVSGPAAKEMHYYSLRVRRYEHVVIKGIHLPPRDNP